MDVLIVHNAYAKPSGEEVMLDRIAGLLGSYGHRVSTFYRSSAEVKGYRGKTKAFFSGMYSPHGRRNMRDVVAQNRPDVAQVQNLFPLISPSVLLECSAETIPIVMRCANYRLLCPSGLLMTRGEVCERCAGGSEWWCVLKNCEHSLPKSLGYALRNHVARRFRLFLDNVAIYICQTEFQKAKLVTAGFPRDRISVIPNMCMPNGFQPSNGLGDHVGYIGRLSPEKGVSALLTAARMLASVEFKAAGSLARMPDLPEQASANLEFVGHLEHESLDRFYKACSMLVVPSVCYEGFPSVIIDTMVRGKPVVCSRIGGLPEIVDDGFTGLLFEPGNAADLAEKIQYLWERPQLCRRMGQAGRAKALREYSPEKYYQRLMAVYERAMELGAPRR